MKIYFDLLLNKNFGILKMICYIIFLFLVVVFMKLNFKVQVLIILISWGDILGQFLDWYGSFEVMWIVDNVLVY